MSPPDISIIIPVYNRGDVIRYTLESVRRASAGLAVETIIVDDGSTPPTAETLDRIGFKPSVLVRQKNQGLLFARLAGLTHAAGRNVLFLDSDDLISAEKLRLQLAAMNATGAAISYSDVGRCEISGDYDALRVIPNRLALKTTDVAEFCLIVQPAPHSPIFRTDWLRRVVATAFFPPSPLYNSVAEIWFYHNAAIHQGSAVYVPGLHTIVGSHPGARLTDQWEKIAAASLGVMEAFARHCPVRDDTAHARQFSGLVAFRTWRRLPRGFSPEFIARTLDLWRRLGPRRSPLLGGKNFQLLAGVVGSESAGRIFRRLQCRPYEQSRTLDNASFEKLLRALPPP